MAKLPQRTDLSDGRGGKALLLVADDHLQWPIRRPKAKGCVRRFRVAFAGKPHGEIWKPVEATRQEKPSRKT